MLDAKISIALYIAGGVTMLLGLVLAVRDWRTRGRLTARAQLLFYAGAVGVLVGLQPLRPFDELKVATYLLPASKEARATLLEELRTQGWVVGVAAPPSLIERDHPLQPEIERRFSRSTNAARLGGGDATQPFVFVGRTISGWSRNPRTTTLSIVFIAAVLLLSSARHLLRRRL